MQCIKLACVLLQLVRQILQNWQTVSPYYLCTRGGNHWWRLSCFVCVSCNLLTACLEEVVIGIAGMRRASGPGLGQRICGCHWNKATAKIPFFTFYILQLQLLIYALQCIKLACVLLQLVRQILQDWQTVPPCPYCLCTEGCDHWWRLSCFVCLFCNL